MATAIMTGMSKLRAADETATPSGETIAVNAKTESMLNMLLPTAFPTAMSRSPRTPATTDVTISGSDVPTATIVNPITS